MKFLFATNARFFAVMLLVLSGFLPVEHSAFAQQNPVPDDLLALDHQRCMNGCVPGFGEQTCKPLCDCTVGEFKKQLSFDTYLDMSVQLTRNTVTPEMREFLGKIANYCTEELDRKGIEVGQGVEGNPADPQSTKSPKKPGKPEKPD